MSQNELAVLLGNKGNVSKVLNRKRKLSLEMIRKLIENLIIPADSGLSISETVIYMNGSPWTSGAALPELIMEVSTDDKLEYCENIRF